MEAGEIDNAQISASIYKKVCTVFLLSENGNTEVVQTQYSSWFNSWFNPIEFNSVCLSGFKVSPNRVQPRKDKPSREGVYL